MSKSTDKVLVKIVCTEKVQYHQLVEMSRDEWEKLKATDERTMEDEDRSPLASVLDLCDVYGSDGFDDIEIDVVDQEGKQVEPADYWDPE